MLRRLFMSKLAQQLTWCQKRDGWNINQTWTLILQRRHRRQLVTIWLDFFVFVEAVHSDKNYTVLSYVFLSIAGRQAIGKEKTFVYGEGESKESCKCLERQFGELCLPQKNTTIERFEFNTSSQVTDENFPTFCTDLCTKQIRIPVIRVLKDKMLKCWETELCAE